MWVGHGGQLGGWVATHIWEHYLYTQDLDFLRAYYPVLYESARFLKALLKPDPKTGWLLTVPSYSPENVFLWEGKPHTLSAGSTFDITVTRTLFKIVREAASLLNAEDEFTRELGSTLEKLPPYRVGKHGQLMEWFYDFDEAYPDHRHTSHLLSLHPFNAIDPAESPGPQAGHLNHPEAPPGRRRQGYRIRQLGGRAAHHLLCPPAGRRTGPGPL